MSLEENKHPRYVYTEECPFEEAEKDDKLISQGERPRRKPTLPRP